MAVMMMTTTTKMSRGKSCVAATGCKMLFAMLFAGLCMLSVRFPSVHSMPVAHTAVDPLFTKDQKMSRIAALESLIEDVRADLSRCEQHTASQRSETGQLSTTSNPSSTTGAAAALRSLGVRSFSSSNHHHRMSLLLDDANQPMRQLNQDAESSASAEAPPVIGICLASTSKSMKHNKAGLEGIPLFTVLLPSLAKTMEPGFEYRVYVGVDAGDKFFDNEQNEKAIIQWFDAHVVPPAKQIGVKCSLKILLFTNENHKPGPAFNHACLTAYDEGADYMYRVNDDSQFMTTFAKHLVAELQNHCPPNVGVTGPTCHEGNTGILTHDFTHRHHMQIFNRQYYPAELTDWWLDDWVTHVYGSAHTSHVLDVVVKHQTGAAGTRYKVNYPAKKALDKLQRDGNAAIREFVGRTFPGVHCDEPVGMVSKTLRVAVHPERVTAIEGVRGLAVDVSTGADHLSAVANEYECSHQCTVHIDCAGYTWLATEASAASGNGGERIGAPDNNNNNNGDSPSGKSVLGMLKAALGVGSADGDASASGDCYIFFDDQAAAATRVFFQPHSMSGARVDHADRFPSRLRSLLTPADPMDANQFSSRAIRVSFGGGRPEELPASWQVDAGTVLASSREPGTFGWNCDLSIDIQQHKNSEFTALRNNAQTMSRSGTCAAPSWTLNLQNGVYRVVVGYADTAGIVLAEGCRLNGFPAHDGAETSGANFEYQAVIAVSERVLVFEGRFVDKCTSIAYIIVDDATHYFDEASALQ